MKKFAFLLVIAGSMLAVSCSVKKGCPSNGKNVGAEKLLSGDAKAMKAAKKAPKFKS